MKISALQQYGIPEPVTQAKVDAHGCIYIGEQFFGRGLYVYFFHYRSLKNPNTSCRGLNIVYT